MRTNGSATPRVSARPHRLRRVVPDLRRARGVSWRCCWSSGFAYETVASTLDRRAMPAPGALFDVGGHHLHLACTGQGSPTVVLETGLGATSSAWALVQPAVASSTRACAYDRAGLGWSQAGPQPRDARANQRRAAHAAPERWDQWARTCSLATRMAGSMRACTRACIRPTWRVVVLIEATPS